MNEIAICQPEKDGISDVDPTSPIELKEEFVILISDEDHLFQNIENIWHLSMYTN